VQQPRGAADRARHHYGADDLDLAEGKQSNDSFETGSSIALKRQVSLVNTASARSRHRRRPGIVGGTSADKPGSIARRRRCPKRPQAIQALALVEAHGCDQVRFRAHKARSATGPSALQRVPSS